MIAKENLKGKYITYKDKNGATRTNRVVRIHGNMLTVIDAVKVKRRVKKEKVVGRCFPKKGLEDILWKKQGGTKVPPRPIKTISFDDLFEGELSLYIEKYAKVCKFEKPY